MFGTTIQSAFGTTLVLAMLAIAGCTPPEDNIITIATINQYESQEDNVELARDIIRYPFNLFAEQELPDLSLDEKEGIKAVSVRDDQNNQVHVQLILTKAATAKKHVFSVFFKQKLAYLIGIHLANQQSIDAATAKADSLCNLLSSDQLPAVWEHLAPVLRGKFTLNDFKETIIKRNREVEPGEKRVIFSRQIHPNAPSFDGATLYVITFSYENAPLKQELFTMLRDADGWKFGGYSYQSPHLQGE